MSKYSTPDEFPKAAREASEQSSPKVRQHGNKHHPPNPRTSSHQDCQRQRRELDELWILSSACHGETPHTAPSYRKGLAFDLLNDSCQASSMGVTVTGKSRPQ